MKPIYRPLILVISALLAIPFPITSAQQNVPRQQVYWNTPMPISIPGTNRVQVENYGNPLTNPLMVQDFMGIVYLIEISNILSGGIVVNVTGLGDQSTNSIRVTEIGNQSTNSIGLSDGTNRAFVTASGELLVSGGTSSTNISDADTHTILLTTSNLLTSIVALQNSISNLLANPIYVGVTNATAAVTNTAGEYLEVVPRASTNAISSLPQAPVGTNSVGGFTLVTNLTITNYVGTDLVAGDSLGANGFNISPLTRPGKGTAILLCATYLRSTNTTADCIDMVLADRAITWPAASSAAGVSASDMPYLQGVITFGTNGLGVGREWTTIDTNMLCTQSGLNIGLTTNVYIYFKTRTATTNHVSDYLKLTISQD